MNASQAVAISRISRRLGSTSAGKEFSGTIHLMLAHDIAFACQFPESCFSLHCAICFVICTRTDFLFSMRISHLRVAQCISPTLGRKLPRDVPWLTFPNLFGYFPRYSC